MANFSYNGPSGITFSADSFEEIYSPGQTGAVVNNIYSFAYTENNSRRLSFYGYLWSNFRFQATILVLKEVFPLTELELLVET